jgi:hypothetical protein
MADQEYELFAIRHATRDARRGALHRRRSARRPDADVAGKRRRPYVRHRKRLRCRNTDPAPSFRIWRLNSLIPTRSSLFIEIFSLLICVGNCPGSGCSTAVSRYEIRSPSSKMRKFPVKFPVSREFARRRARSALRRQPGSADRMRTGRLEWQKSPLIAVPLWHWKSFQLPTLHLLPTGLRLV